MTKEKLEKEAEEKFKVNNKDKDREHFYNRIWFKTGYLAGAEPREEHIEELEKENERLKGDLELWESGGCRATNLFECGVVKELKDQLTKAKEIIKQLMYASRDCIAWYCLCDKAKQFLKEIEK